MSLERRVGARFMPAGRMYFFELGDVEGLELNDWVIVETDLGKDAARVQLLPTDSPVLHVDPPLGRLLRKATASDKLEINRRKRAEPETVAAAERLARGRGLRVKLLGADWAFDGASVTLFYSSDERVELGGLVADLEAQFGARVELRRMGARDETKVMTGVGTCGRELCCSSWLDKFSNISIRMAKEQDLPLNQSKLTGVCGRLKCCLIYELETYQEVKGRLPKLGETFHLPSCVSGQCGTGGCAQVAGTNVPKEAVVVTTLEGGRLTLTAAELGVEFAAVPAHTKGVGSYGSDEVPRQERATPVPQGTGKRRRRRRGRRRGGGALPGPAPQDDASADAGDDEVGDVR
ncbi:MAG TPA: regulatory iron-sulfur-containing complex subunit RicT [Candidatus Limnocylindria bacterium]|nr:regulatory iron-sulfur-containing complex subunit RicT [Candidatus Limnocylindria bacterium]